MWPSPSRDALPQRCFYTPAPIDVSQGFVARMDVSVIGSNGIAFVVKNPANGGDYIETPDNPHYGSINGVGAYGISKSLGMALITQGQTKQDASDRHFSEVQVFVDDASGNATSLADITNLNLDPSVNGNNIFQVRYLPRFGTLDVYIGSQLITRVPNVDLTQLGVTPGGSAELGITSGVPGVQSDGNSSDEYTPFPAILNHFSVGNQLVFGSGFGPNYYEDRFPFAETGQSVWGTGNDYFEYAPFIEKSGSTGTQSIGTSYSPSDVSVFSLNASGSISYDVGLGLDATATGGQANITYPLFLDMAFPAQYSAASGVPFTLPITFYPDLAASITTTSPSANVTANVTCKTNFSVGLSASVFGQSIASGTLFSGSTNVNHTKFFDAQGIVSSGLIPNVSGGVSYAGYLQGNEGSTGQSNPTHDGTPGAGSTTGGGKAGKAGGLLSKYISVGITIPDLSTSGTVTGFGPTGSHLTSSASSPFVTFSSDFTNSVLAEIPGLDLLMALPFFNNDYSLSLGGQSVELGFHIADIYGDVNVGPEVDYDFAPAPQVYLRLSAPTSGYPQTLGPFSLDPATMHVLNPPALTMPSDGSPLTVTPSVVLNASTLQTTGKFTVSADLSINPLLLSFAYNGSGVDTDSLFGFPLTASGSIAPYSYTTTFPVNSFQTSLPGKSFTLFPMASSNPLIDAVLPAAAQAGSANVAVALVTEQASINGEVVWDYDGIPNDPHTDLTSRVWNSNASVAATIPSSLLAVQGTHTITLINHNNGDTQMFPSNLFTFTVTAPAPILTSLGVSTVTTGGAAFTLNVSGSSFSPAVAATAANTGYPGSVVL
ncbi:MAG: hypothetical protein ACRYFS_08190 [Janthinobacterium lividum]